MSTTFQTTLEVGLNCDLGVEEVGFVSDSQEPYTHEHYIKVVSTTFIPRHGKPEHAYEYTINSNMYPAEGKLMKLFCNMPAAVRTRRFTVSKQTCLKGNVIVHLLSLLRDFIIRDISCTLTAQEPKIFGLAIS